MKTCEQILEKRQHPNTFQNILNRKKGERLNNSRLRG